MGECTATMRGKPCRPQWPPSQAGIKAAWGSRDAHVQSTTTRPPRPQAIGTRGAPHLPFGFALKPSPSAPWARGLLSAFWERGSQTCLPAAHGVAPSMAWYGPPSSSITQDPRKGPSLAGRTVQGLFRGGLTRQAREEAETSRKGTSRGARDASRDDQD